MYNEVTEVHACHLERRLLWKKEAYEGIFSRTFLAMLERINRIVKFENSSTN